MYRILIFLHIVNLLQILLIANNVLMFLHMNYDNVCSKVRFLFIENKYIHKWLKRYFWFKNTMKLVIIHIGEMTTTFINVYTN